MARTPRTIGDMTEPLLAEARVRLDADTRWCLDVVRTHGERRWSMTEAIRMLILEHAEKHDIDLDM